MSTIDNLFLELTASTTNLGQSLVVESEAEIVRFVPAFVISKSNIILTDNHKSDTVKISGVPLQLKNLEV